MEIKLLKLVLYKMTKPIFEDFMTKSNLKDDTMNESQFQSVYKQSIYPRDSKIYSDEKF